MNASSVEPVEVIKSLNSSVVLAKDASGYEWLLLGKGIGFGRRPGDLVDPADADRAFIPLSNAGAADQMQALSSLTPERLKVTEAIVEYAEGTLQCELNRYILVALTDHLAFVLERADTPARTSSSLWWEVQDLYPDEYEVARHALTIVAELTGTQLPDDEAASIALHIVNALQTRPDMPSIGRLSTFLEWLGEHVDSIAPSTSQKSKARVMRQGRVLFQRLLAHELLAGDVAALMETYSTSNPEVIAATTAIADHIAETTHVQLPDEERLHLALHLQPIIASTQA